MGGAIRLTTRGQSEAQDRLECASRVCHQYFVVSCFAAAVHGRGGDGSTLVIHIVRISRTHTRRFPRGSISGWNADPLWLSSGSGLHKVRVGAQGMSGCTRYEWVHKVRVGGTRSELVCKVRVGGYKVRVGAQGTSGCARYEWVHMVRVGAQGTSVGSL